MGDPLLMGDLEGGLAAVRAEGDQALARTSEAAKDGDHVFGCFATISDSLARRRVSSTPSPSCTHGEKSSAYQVFLTRQHISSGAGLLNSRLKRKKSIER